MQVKLRTFKHVGVFRAVYLCAVCWVNTKCESEDTTLTLIQRKIKKCFHLLLNSGHLTINVLWWVIELKWYYICLIIYKCSHWNEVKYIFLLLFLGHSWTIRFQEQEKFCLAPEKQILHFSCRNTNVRRHRQFV